ncbi:aldehyde dehydrogenase family protein [Acidiplasma sp.]|uniref:aldehyde dehydrogenase family protein n=1 Tax=Acidiplasma sp. TaxID=1872114 RepID=UPI002589CB99|nr:aldehyde dehydrogenase family protein [Acidiplasma sp.]
MEKIFGNFIDGKINEEGDKIKMISPSDGSTAGYCMETGRDATDYAVNSSLNALDKISKINLKERQKLLLKLADIIESKSEIYSNYESLNTGKTIRQSSFMDIPLGIEHIRYFGTVQDFRESREIEHPEYPGTRGIIQYVPMGTVAAIAPWNVPFLMAIWKVIPALLAGNSVVLKPSHYTPLTALELARDIKNAGFPDGSVNVISGKGKTTGNYLIENEKINMISFTGSTYTGKLVMEKAAKNLKKITLELGGKSPNIVFDDADIDRSVKGVLFGIYLNSGQLCESGSRLILSNKIRDKFMERMKYYLSNMVAGNPMDFNTDISAITNNDQLKKINNLMESGINEGATVYYSRDLKNKVPENGFYYPPTLLMDVKPDMKIFNEEIFGPVLSVTTFDTDNEAVEIANNTKYGLAAGIWTGDLNRAYRVASNILAGTVWINDYHLLSAAAPRGGFKMSGIGRELGLEGIYEFTQTRHLFYGNPDSGLSDAAYQLLIKE